jgi:uncharacterized protein DUF6804
MTLINKTTFSKLIIALLKIANIGSLLIAIFSKQQYSYFVFLRWFIMTSFVYYAYKSFTEKQIELFIFYVAISILFNPFKKVWFQKDTWHLIDGLVAALLLLTILYDLTRKNTTAN